jgi:hypothetical protein
MGSMTLPPKPTRVVVVVPRREPGVHEYLQRSLACLTDVEVVLDRRAVAATPADDRRRSEQHSERQLLICSLVHCAVVPPTPPPPPTPGPPDTAAPRRTLLWPDLRLEHL